MPASINPFFLLFLAALSAFVAHGQTKQEPDVAAALRSMGYSLVDSNPQFDNPSLASNAPLPRERWISLRSIRQVPNWPHAYYRFTLVIAEFASEEEAADHIRRMHDNPFSQNNHPDLAKSFPLRNGFQIGRRTYILSTDVNKFFLEQEDRILDQLHRALTGLPFKQ